MCHCLAPRFCLPKYWKGAVAASTFLEYCWAIVRAVTLLKISPTTIPLTPPSGFWRAINLPVPQASMILAPELARTGLQLVREQENRQTHPTGVVNGLRSCLKGLVPRPVWLCEGCDQPSSKTKSCSGTKQANSSGNASLGTGGSSTLVAKLTQSFVVSACERCTNKGLSVGRDLTQMHHVRSFSEITIRPSKIGGETSGDEEEQLPRTGLQHCVILLPSSQHPVQSDSGNCTVSSTEKFRNCCHQTCSHAEHVLQNDLVQKDQTRNLSPDL